MALTITVIDQRHVRPLERGVWIATLMLVLCPAPAYSTSGTSWASKLRVLLIAGPHR